MMRWDKEWTKAQAWGCPCHSKKYPRSTSVKAWGCPRGIPSSSAKIRSPFKTLYFYCFMHYVFFLEHLVFSFQFHLVLFAAINGWTPIIFFWRSCLAFSFAKNTLFSLLSFNECSLFLLLHLVFFLPWFVFRYCYIFASRCILISGPCWFSSKELFQKGLNGVGKEKQIYVKSGTKRSLCRLRPRLLHIMLDVFLIVCLVVLL
jgi:hypothetical protein